MTTMEVKVVFKPINNCLINLPSNLITPILNSTNLLVQQIVIAIIDEKDDKIITYCGWTGFISSNLKTIEIDPHYAGILNINANKLVKINLILDLNFPDFAQSVELEPVSTPDWELTELYAQSIEDKFLSQVRCISVNEKLVIRSNNNSNDTSGLIYYNVKNIKSLKGDLTVGRIGNDSELHIIPKPYRKSNKSIPSSNSNVHIEKKNQKSISSRRSGIGPIEHTGQIFRCAINKEGEGLTIYSKPVKSFKGIEFFQISVIEGPGTPKRARRVTNKELSMGLSAEDFASPIVAKYVEILDDDDDQSYNQDGRNITLSPLLAITLGLEGTCGEKVLLESCNKKIIKLDPANCEIVITKFITESKNEIDEENNLLLKGNNSKKLQILEWKRQVSVILKETMIKIYGMKNLVPLTNGLKLPIIEEILPNGGKLEIITSNNDNNSNKNGNNSNSKIKKLLLSSWILVNNENFPLDFKFKNEKLIPKSRVQETDFSKSNDNIKVVGQHKLIRKLISVLKNGMSTLLYGKSGNGKTIICNQISEFFSNKGYYVKNINCEIDIEIENDDDDDSISKDEEKNKIKKSLKFFNKLVQSLNWHSPSLVILDNLDSIIPKELENADNGNSLQLTELITNKFENLIKQSAVTLLITSKTKDSINNLIFKKHLIEEEFNLKSPNKDQRFELLSNLIKTKLSKLYDYDFEKNILSDIVAETEGYLPIDLENLVDRSYHDLISNDDEKFELKHFLNGIKGYTPSSLRGAKLQKDMGTNWSDIGGLIEVKKLLLETLEWPTKYAPIFKNCPLRLRSGILLYGYPGCGKTLLASAVASQCGLNFISIKGPEILNKYIGASEQSIRELFDRASSAKPCILFFDEFDSIAPKRGHDSTGVTDRIVNQLLTQMDGAEGLDGVYVLAATSRPDLIDSALLRPGRLDKSILCDLPDLENRLDILNTIVKSNKFNIDSDVDLHEIAKLTEGYSGADLQAVVYNSYLKGVHESLDNQMKKGKDQENFDNGKQQKLEFFTLGYANKNTKRNDLQISKKLETIIDNEKLGLKEDKLDNDKSGFKKPIIFIRAKHLEEGLKDTKKSISNKELTKFKNIYSQLVDGKREGELPDGEGSKEVGVRATLM